MMVPMLRNDNAAWHRREQLDRALDQSEGRWNGRAGPGVSWPVCVCLYIYIPTHWRAKLMAQGKINVFFFSGEGGPGGAGTEGRGGALRAEGSDSFRNNFLDVVVLIFRNGEIGHGLADMSPAPSVTHSRGHTLTWSHVVQGATGIDL